MLSLELHKSAKKFIEKLPQKQARQVAARIQELRLNPRLTDSILMRGCPDTWRNTCGEYRIIYKFDTAALRISIIDKRNDNQAYKAHSRRR